MPTLAITGGKGGTGKTLIATNLAVQLACDGYSVLLVDTDVENPNSNILLGVSLEGESVERKPISIFTPQFDEAICTQCGICRSACYRHAILQFSGSFPSVMDHMCSGCHTCERVCPTHAISNKGRIIGHQYFLPQVQPKLDLIIGELLPSEAVSVLVVESLLNSVQTKVAVRPYDFIVIDTAPGAHCDVEKSLDAADLILAVTEPTPFGLHDLERIVELLHLNNQSAAVILNRSNLTAFRAPLLAKMAEQNIEVIGEIPVDPVIIEDYARGIPFVSDHRDFEGKTAFIALYRQILSQIHSLQILGGDQ